jgi:ZIP family zinc transporter
MSLQPKAPPRALGLVAVLLLIAALALAVLAGRSMTGQTMTESADSTAGELVVEQTTFAPGAVELSVRNTAAEPVQIAQVFVNDAYVDMVGAGEPIDPDATTTLRLDYPWQEGQPYLVSLLTSTGSVVEHEIEEAGEPAGAEPTNVGTLALLGAALVVLGAAVALLLLTGVHRWLFRGTTAEAAAAESRGRSTPTGR